MPIAEDHQIGDVMARVAAGDGEAFEELYDSLAPRVWAIAHTTTGRRDLAEAAAILVFQDLWRRAASCPADPDAAIGWALAIAVHRCTEQSAPRRHRRNAATRRCRRPAARTGDGSRPGGRTTTPSPVLSPEQREAILLSCYGGLTLKQTAAAMEVDQPSAAALLCDGLRRVRAQPPDQRFHAVHR
jgi:RNA polymerase sigma-70 factor, ECF subfamily